jgi:sugar phosphate isomerase/epimerase
MRRLIDACAAAGAKSLLMGGIGKEDLVETYYKAIAECCDYAAEKNLPITVKPHGGLNATGTSMPQVDREGGAQELRPLV